MNSYISYEDALKKGMECFYSKKDVEGFLNDDVKKCVIEAIKDDSWRSRFCYDSHVENSPVMDFSLEPGFLFEDFYANETFVMFAEFASHDSWKQFLDGRLNAHCKAAKGREEYYEMMARRNGYLAPLSVDEIHMYFNYYILRSGVVEYLLEHGDIEKVREFVSREEVKESRDLQGVIKGKFDNLFLKHLEDGAFGGFFDFWVELVMDGCFKNIKLSRSAEKIFAEKYPSEFETYKKLFRDSL